jgi:hypothetical protein
MAQRRDWLVQLSQDECAKKVVENSAVYLEKGGELVVASARAYVVALGACKFPGLSSPERDKAWAAGDAFWLEFAAYMDRQSEKQAVKS